MIDKKFLFSYSEDANILDILYSKLDWEIFNEYNYNKLKILELREFCDKLNIETTKLSHKTNKQINKTKKELIDNIRTLHI